MKNKILRYAVIYLVVGVVVTLWARRRSGDPKLLRLPQGREWLDLATWPFVLGRLTVSKLNLGSKSKRDLTPVQPRPIVAKQFSELDLTKDVQAFN